MSTQHTTHRELQRGDSVDLYLRMSRDPDHDKLGVDRQEKACRDLCKRRGWKVAVVHTDDDRSAFSRKTRKGYEELLRRLKTGHVRGLVAWHPDRLHRSTRELDDFIDIVNATGAGVATVQGGDYDLTTASGRMTAGIVGRVAQHESEHKSERIREKMLQLRRGNKMTGRGRRAYGYERDNLRLREPITLCLVRDHSELVIDEPAIVRELTRRYIGGESLLSLVRDLNVRSIPAATGGTWGLASVSRLLRSRRIAGLRDVEGKDEAAPWTAIITEREHRQLTTLLARNHLAGTRSQRRYLLTGGLVVCAAPHAKDKKHPEGICGAAMIGRPINGKMTYGCDKARGGCGKVWVRAERVDEVVRESVVQVVDAPKLSKRLRASSGKSDTVLDAINRQEQKLREFEEDYNSGELERAEYRRLRDLGKGRLEELRKTYKPEPTELDYSKDNPLALAWPALSLGGRRAVLDATIKRVRIMPVGHRAGQTFKAKDRFDTERVRIDWKV